MGTPGMKRAPLRLVGGIGDRPGNVVEPRSPLLPVGEGGQKPFCVGVNGVSEDLPGIPLFHDKPRIHDVDPVRDAGDHPQVVGDIQDGHGGLFLNRFQQIQNLCLHGHIQGRGGLVGDHQIRVAGQGHGDHDPLPLPPAQLMGIILQTLLRRGDAHVPQELDAPFVEGLL